MEEERDGGMEEERDGGREEERDGGREEGSEGGWGMQLREEEDLVLAAQATRWCRKGVRPGKDVMAQLWCHYAIMCGCTK